MNKAASTLMATSTGALLAATAYFLVWPSSLLPETDPSPILASTTPLPLSIYCSGPLALLGGADGTELGSLELVGSATVLSHVGQGLEASGLTEQIESGQRISLVSETQTTNALSAIQTQVVDLDRMAGLAANYCAKPATQGYFASGMAAVGDQSILHLANPNNVEVQVTLNAISAAGESRELVTLAADEQIQISMAALAEGEPIFGLEYFSNGPSVSAALQNRSVSGLAATGLELVNATQLATEVFIPGLEISEGSINAPRLRVLNPDTQEITVRVTVHGMDVYSDVFEITVPGRAIVEQELDLEPGDYLVELGSSGGFAASIWNQKLGTSLDYAWLVPAELFVDSVTLPVTGSELVVANSTDEPINVAVLSSGQYQSVTIASRSQYRLGVQGPDIRVQSDSGFLLALQLENEFGYAAISPTENLNLGSDLEIVVR